MMKKLPIALALTVGVAAGAASMHVYAQGAEQKPAFIVVSSSSVTNADAEKLAAYGAKAGPLARDAGISILARGNPTVLEGEYTHETVTIERFDSMKALKAFWFSDGYQEAKKLREGQADIAFIVAIEGS